MSIELPLLMQPITVDEQVVELLGPLLVRRFRLLYLLLLAVACGCSVNVTFRAVRMYTYLSIWWVRP